MLSTSELLVEHIISGILSLVWIIAIVLCVVGIDPKMIEVTQRYWGLLAVVTTAIAYPIGIFVDTVADKILHRRDNRIKEKYGLTPDQNLMNFFQKTTTNTSNTIHYFTYNRSKTRVARSSFLNFALIAIAGALFVFIRGNSMGIENVVKIGLTTFILFAALSFTAFVLWREIANTVHRRTKQLWDGV